MDRNNDMLVQDFIGEPGVFFLGVKALNQKSVAAARSIDRVLPIVGKHLYREIHAETCWNGGRIDRSRSAMNFSLLSDVPMTSEMMVGMARAAVADNGIEWAALRKDKIVGVELVISLPVTFQGNVQAFFEDSLAWIRLEFPQPITVVAAVVHLDEAAPHMHVILIPVVGPGRLDGHQVVGYKGKYSKRVNSFYEKVAQRFGLGKPRRKVSLSYRERQQLANRVLHTMMADSPTWADSGAAVMAMRQTLTLDPTPMARALGLLNGADDNAPPTADAVASAAGAGATASGGSTALLCYAVGSEAGFNDARNSAGDRVRRIIEGVDQFDDGLVRDELSRLVIHAPYSPNRALNVPVAAFSQSPVAGPGSSASANTVDVSSVKHDTPDTAAASCLCSDVDAVQMGKASDQAHDPHSTRVPVYVENYAEDAVRDLGHDDAFTAAATVSAKELVRERESERPVSAWVEELGCHIEPASPKPSNRAKAEEAVFRATNRLPDRSSIKPN
jgi:hypothetical protein